jgi:hypothetical protein
MPKMTANGWTKEHIQHLLSKSHLAVERAVVQIYHRQTEDEQSYNSTSESNGIGFTGCDAPFLSKIAANCIQYNGLTEKQVAAIRPKMLKYWRQLLEIAAESEKTPNFSAPEAPKKARKTKQLELTA